MVYNKHEWQNGELITADGLNNIEDGILISGKVLNVKDFGAVGDKINDDSFAINSVFLKASNDDTHNVYIPEGTYLVKNDIDFQSNINVILHPEAIIYGPGMYYRFRSFGKGYGNGVSNVTVTGGCFSGDFDSNITYGHTSSNAMVGVFHHCENITFKNVKFNMTTSDSHTFDLGGCRNIIIDNCEFYGIKPSRENREFVEAIQIDYSSAGGLTDKSESELNNVDGLVTYGVHVKNCKFDAIYNTDGTIQYYAPNPIGQHASYSDDLPHDISFENNDVINSTQFSSANYINGWVHFFGINRLLIKNNNFINEKSHPAVAIGLIISTSDPLGSATENNNGKVLYDQHSNVTIENNTIKGFNSPTDVKGLVQLNGNYTSAWFDKNINVTKNDFEQNYPTSADKNKPSILNGSDAIVFRNVSDIVIVNNFVSEIRRFISSGWSNPSQEDVTITIKNNLLKGIYYVPIVILDLNSKPHVIIENNTFISVNGFARIHGAFYVSVSNNYVKYRDGKIISGESYNNTTLWVINNLNSIIKNNVFIQSNTVDYQYPKAIINNSSTLLSTDGNYFNGTLQ